MNPWISIWLKPRQTIREIVDTDSKRWVLLLAALAGVSTALVSLLSLEFPQMLTMLITSIKNPTSMVPIAFIVLGIGIIGTVFGIAGLFLYGWLYRIVGGWFGGKATSLQIRAAIAWVEIPRQVSVPLLLCVLLLAVSIGETYTNFSSLLILLIF